MLKISKVKTCSIMLSVCLSVTVVICDEMVIVANVSILLRLFLQTDALSS